MVAAVPHQQTGRALFAMRGPDGSQPMLRGPQGEPQPSGASGICWLMGITSNLINRNMPDFKFVIIWTQTRLKLTYELSMKIEFVT